MNRYPIWKYIIILIVVVIAVLYSIPNLYGEQPAVQISSAKATLKIEPSLLAKVNELIVASKITNTVTEYQTTAQGGTIKIRVNNETDQKIIKSVLETGLNTDKNDESYIIALNLLPATPKFLQAIAAKPMYLGLDLRGGVHFLMQVDMNGAVNKRIKGLASDIRVVLAKEKLRHGNLILSNTGDSLEFLARNEFKDKIAKVLKDNIEQIAFIEQPDTTPTNGNVRFIGQLTKQAIQDIKSSALQKNIETLNKRVNELGVAEPVIQRQGDDRIIVQLPGVQDVAKAKDIIGRTATLEVRMVDESVTRGTELFTPIPFESELFTRGNSVPVVLYKDVVLTGDSIMDATASFDQNQQPAVSLDLTAEGGKIMSHTTSDKIGKAMAVILFEKNKGEVLTVATIQSELSSKFQITGMGSAQAAADLALLMRAGSLAAPMDIIEERTIGPSLGSENIQKGYNSMIYGFAAIAIFMAIYYALFGVFSVIALGINMALLFAILSILQATLTLPGMAAIALALGMAIDANVLINERIREELRLGVSPQIAIHTGFERAWATILDSNITTLIAGIALLTFGSGPVRGFAVVHCLGILTSMFSAVMVARGLVNVWYGSQKKLTHISIGQIWRADTSTVLPSIK